MAIEIKELHIKINVNEGKKHSGTTDVSKENKKDITAACVEYVMDTLHRQKER